MRAYTNVFENDSEPSESFENLNLSQVLEKYRWLLSATVQRAVRAVERDENPISHLRALKEIQALLITGTQFVPDESTKDIVINIEPIYPSTHED